MSAGCGHHVDTTEITRSLKRVLWAVLIINAAMFVVEISAGVFSGSVSLLADAVDFLGDSASYAISLFVLDRSLRWRAGAAFMKGLSMGAFGLWIIGTVIYNSLTMDTPVASVMGSVGLMAMLANLLAAFLLFKYRNGDANMRSVWLCTRNDVLGNLAVVVAASGVFATGSQWPDLAVALILASLALQASWQVLRQATTELRTDNLQGSQSARAISD
ncbi:MAG: cation transporter [Alphaproteobacteria bacterium]|jgi:Co/Zn/Cd efflux system component|nr:cation transporter [Alphaproteobacteria bacterium]MBT4085093.1 cation transporter [Alphaproteobacteria bacterium]MBT4546108.1 cation transporter [Alphaproteobacteria bacterium]MBT7746353.1 cation transporter [Alphaproteobacteria bacterium]